MTLTQLLILTSIEGTSFIFAFILIVCASMSDFSVILQGAEIKVAKRPGQLQLTLIVASRCQIYFSLLNDVAMPPATNCKNTQQLYDLLRHNKEDRSRWQLVGQSVVEVATSKGNLQLKMEGLTSIDGHLKILLGKILQVEGRVADYSQQVGKFSELTQARHDVIEQKMSMLGSKGPVQEERFDSPRSVGESDLSVEVNRLQSFVYKCHQKMETMSVQWQEKNKELHRELASYRLGSIREEIDRITEVLDLQVRVKEFRFVPEERLLGHNKALHYLNEKTVKNCADANGYNMVVSGGALERCKQRSKIRVNFLKNSGLLFGICRESVLSSLDKANFNHPDIVCLTSCGFVANGGEVQTVEARVRAGDEVGIVVDVVGGRVEWWVNGVAVVGAEVAWLSRPSQRVHLILGLGFFGDEVEIVVRREGELKKVSDNQQRHQSEIDHLNKIIRRYSTNQ